MYMLWHEKYETGNEQVDTEHKEIFMLVQKVIDAAFDDVSDKIGTTLDFLASYAVNHFANEEKIMDESSYPQAAIHKKQHSDFVQDFLALKERVSKETDNTKNSLEINKVIVDWLTEHVLGSDKIMANYYKTWVKSNA